MPWPLMIVRITDNRGLGDFGMGDERALDLGSAEPVAGDIDHVIDPARSANRTRPHPAGRRPR